jgi:hypothetical protein
VPEPGRSSGAPQPVPHPQKDVSHDRDE